MVKDGVLQSQKSAFKLFDFRAVAEKCCALVPEYVKDYVSLIQFAA